MKDVVSYSLYAKYPGLSKAKMLREFIKDESETYVGKTIVLLINYMNENGLMTDDKKEKAEKLYEFGKKLLGKSNTQHNPKQQNSEPKNNLKVDYDSLNASLLAIENISSPQARGYAFEKYLNSLFHAFGLDPHASYRTDYDQIDGSFILDGNTILIEAKYKANAIPKDDLILFSNKIGSKSHFSKGLFITYSRVDEKAIEYFTDSSSRLVVLTVEELFIMCQNNIPLQNVLQDKYRSLDERGLIFKHIMNLL
ncbi:hypothetical protein AQPE_2741 [Aquipluma nitroreducens]|uniref:Restriction endonuclease type IV Mrr domain-containing protein n=2 Tax=Aquipluma nitroreducens TaxID=2010828 RepID=A0A5K7SAG8_9BACT|nr:hypothetical protein AQPE_2741 [Aquipluma nitroreducens]